MSMSHVMEPAPREVLLFTLDGQRYGLPAEDIRELLQ